MTFQMISVAVAVPLRIRENQFAALGGEPALARYINFFRFFFPGLDACTEYMFLS